MAKATLNKYYCKHCGKTVKRDSDKQWVKSYCDVAEKTVHLQRVCDHLVISFNDYGNPYCIYCGETRRKETPR